MRDALDHDDLLWRLRQDMVTWLDHIRGSPLMDRSVYARVTRATEVLRRGMADLDAACDVFEEHAPVEWLDEHLAVQVKSLWRVRRDNVLEELEAMRAYLRARVEAAQVELQERGNALAKRPRNWAESVQEMARALPLLDETVELLKSADIP